MSVYLETPSKDALNYLANYISLTEYPITLDKIRKRELFKYMTLISNFLEQSRYDWRPMS